MPPVTEYERREKGAEPETLARRPPCCALLDLAAPLLEPFGLFIRLKDHGKIQRCRARTNTKAAISTMLRRAAFMTRILSGACKAFINPS